MSFSGKTTAIISPPVFFGVAWTFAGICLVLLAFRLYVRISSYRRLYADDVFAIAAWIFFVASNILWHLRLSSVYVLTDFLDGKGFPGPDKVEASLLLLKSLVAFNILYLCSLWSIKISFILFFRRLGERLAQKYIKIWWWFVTIITVAAFAVCVGFFDYGCSVSDLGILLANCLGQSARDREALETRINTSMDIMTDGLIITIPVVILWDSRLPTRKKFGLIGIFGLSLLTMIFALIRLLVLPAGTVSSDFTWTFLWSNIEVGVAIMVACLGAFRQLYVNKKDKDQKGYVESHSAAGSRRSGWGVFTKVCYIFTPGGSRRKSSKGLHGSWSGPFSGGSLQKHSEVSTELSSRGGNNHDPQNTLTTKISSQALRVPTSTYADPERDAWSMDRSKYIDVTVNDSRTDNQDDDLESYRRPFHQAHDGTLLFNNIHVEQSFMIESNAVPKSRTEDPHSRGYIRKPSR